MTTEDGDADTASKHVLQQLSDTVYACSSLSPLSSRPGNFVYRGVLVHPLSAKDEAPVRTVIIKHCTTSTSEDAPDHMARRVDGPNFEELLLNSIAHFSPLTDPSILIKVPRLHLLDEASNIQVLEDFIDSTGLKSMLLSAEASNLLPSSLEAIGFALGLWLRAFHVWAAAPEQAALRAQMWQSDPMRKTKYLFTYHVFLKVLETHPEVLEDHREILEKIQDTISKEYERPSTEDDEDLGLIHGDFWSGNILLPATPWREPPLSGGPNKLFIIDWEFAQFGHRSNDIGQLIGDLYERKLYGKVETVAPVMEGVIRGYGELSEQMAFRVAIYVGVHLIGWYNRRPQKGPKVVPSHVILEGLTIGRDFIIKGWEKDRKYFENSALASLFRRV
ncbi:Phosphotransferase enzyme family protein [Trichoderma simmonsii]|uniref:Phosphotransferase enzyme family protein n=1 Tax=Trichoderma simmonsii TaxID=1491479 RepID=A0A8G0L8W1_9HYPO|nr:Phosphotransferase enzyme family protein [Trichoderma simmonsii]